MAIYLRSNLDPITTKKGYIRILLQNQDFPRLYTFQEKQAFILFPINFKLDAWSDQLMAEKSTSKCSQSKRMFLSWTIGKEMAQSVKKRNNLEFLESIS